MVLIDLDHDGLEETKKLISNSAVYTYSCDVSNAESVEKTFGQIAQDVNRIDYAVNCAGVNSNWKPSVETSPETFDQITSINFRGVWLCMFNFPICHHLTNVGSRAELMMMQKQSLDSEVYDIPTHRAQRGAIVHIASSLANFACPAAATYSATKAAVNSMARADAIDNSPHRIRINTGTGHRIFLLLLIQLVMPGLIDTPMTIPGREQIASLFIPKVPMKRFGLAEEIADTCVFLCSNKASFIQGTSISVDGGLNTGTALPD